MAMLVSVDILEAEGGEARAERIGHAVYAPDQADVSDDMQFFYLNILLHAGRAGQGLQHHRFGAQIASRIGIEIIVAQNAVEQFLIASGQRL